MQYPPRSPQLALALALALPVTATQTADAPLSQPLCTPVDTNFIPMCGNALDTANNGACPPSPLKKPRTKIPPFPSPNLELSAAFVTKSSYGTQTTESNSVNCSMQSATLTQTQLPDMSQDTLALFPSIVAEHAVQQQQQQQQQQCTNLSQFNVWVAGCAPGAALRPPRHPSSASLPLAKASLLSTLHAHPPLRNPFTHLDDSQPKSTDNSKKSKVLPAFTNASESFDENDLYVLGNPPTSKSQSSVNQQVSSLKTCIVASSQPFSSLLHFNQENQPLHSTFSTVIKATSRIDGISYALKRNIVPFSSPSEKLSALQEVFALAALQDIPQVLRYHTAWWEAGGRHLVTQCEWVQGGCVKPPLSVSELLLFGSTISSVLARMHELGIVHLDVKPENVFVGTRSGTKAYLLGDFGMSRRVDKKHGTLFCDKFAGFHDTRSLEGDSRYLCPEAMDTQYLTTSKRSRCGKARGSQSDDCDTSLSYESDENSSDARGLSRRSAVREQSRSALQDTRVPDVCSTLRPIKRRKRVFRSHGGLSDDDSDNSNNGFTAVPTLFSGTDGEGENDDDDDDDDRDSICSSSETDKSNDEDNNCASTLQKSAHRSRRKLTSHGKQSEPDDEMRSSSANSRNLIAADVFSLGASLYELATGEELMSSGPSWQWLRKRNPQVVRKVQKATGSRPLARIIGQCLARNPLERPSAASAAAMFAEIGPEKSALEKALTEIAALKQSNKDLRAALSHIAASGRSKTPRASAVKPGRRTPSKCDHR